MNAPDKDAETHLSTSSSFLTTEEESGFQLSSSIAPQTQSKTQQLPQTGTTQTRDEFSFYYDPKQAYSQFTTEDDEGFTADELGDSSRKSHQEEPSTIRSETPHAHQPNSLFANRSFPALSLPYQADTSSTSLSHHRPSSSREALKRQIHLLELSLAEAQAVADAKSKTFYSQISVLEEVIAGLKSQIQEKDGIITKQKNTILQLTSAVPSVLQNDTNDTHPNYQQAAGLIALNTDLIAQNSQLRTECGLLKSKLEEFVRKGMIDGIGESTEEDSQLFPNRVIPSTIKEEVDRILNPQSFLLPRIHGPVKREKQSQTDEADTYDPTKEEIIDRLKEDNQKLEQSFQIEKDINQELIGSVQSLKEEINSLSTQYTKLSNDAEVALASERVALDQLDSLERNLNEKTKQLIAVEKAYKTLEKTYGKLDVEYQVIKGAYTILEKKGEQSSMDPLLFLETQWAKDRHEFYTQTTGLQSQITSLTSKNTALNDEIKNLKTGVPDQAEYTRIIKELSMFKNKVKTLEADDRVKEGKCCALESQVLKLETLLDAKQKQVKDFGIQVSLLKKELTRKQELVSSQVTKMTALENEKQTFESKARLESSMISSKEHLIKECRLKIKDLQEKTGKIDIDQASLTTLQANLRDAKSELVRKTALVKQWKDKCIQLEKDVAQLSKNAKEMIDPKTHLLVQQANRHIKDKSAKLEPKLALLESRNLQFCNVVTRFISDCLALQAPGSIVDSLLPSSTSNFGVFKDIDVNQVDQLAQKLSKELLHVEWSEISMNHHPSASALKDIEYRLQKVLKEDLFEIELYSLLFDTFKSF